MDVTRVVLTGPECTGKTTLAATLAARFGAPWVPEAARLYAQRASGPLSLATVGPIARLSMELQDTALAVAPPLLFLDTDLISTVIYSLHYYGEVEPWIAEAARARRAELYLLAAPDIPWTPDGVRDRPMRREELFDTFATTLESYGARVVTVYGEGTARTEVAVRAVEALMG